MLLRRRIISYFLAIAALIAIVSVIHMFFANSISKQFTMVMEKSTPALRLIETIEKSAMRMQGEAIGAALIKNIVLTKEAKEATESEMAETEEAFANMSKSIQQYVTLTNRKAIADGLMKSGQSMFRLSKELVSDKVLSGGGSSIFAKKEDLEDAEKTFLAAIGEARNMERKLTESSYENAILAQERGQLISWIAMFFSLGAALMLGMFFTGRLIKPILSLGNAFKRVEDGDYNTIVKADSKDELGLLTESFNHMVSFLSESRSYIESIIKSLPNMLIVIDSDNRIITTNNTTEQVLGYEKKELLGKPIITLLAGEGIVPALQNIIKKKTVLNSKKLLVAKNGSRIPTLFSASTLFSSDGKIRGIVCIAQDVSRFEQLEEQVRQSQKIDSIGRLAGGVAHDFNNLLTVILGVSQILENEQAQNSAVADKAKLISDTATRAAILTKQLLTFSRQEVIRPRVIDLNTAMKESKKMLDRLIGENIAIEFHSAPNLHPIKADVGQINQILMNLAVNARDAMPDGGKLIFETSNVDIGNDYILQHHESLVGAYVMMVISDTGIGMDEKTKNRIFEPFFTTKGVGKGTGLGMSTVFGIVKQNNGMIQVYSEPGKGSTFKIYWPKTEILEIQESNVSEGTAVPTGQESILLVEDEEAVRMVTAATLRKYGYTVLEASNSAEAIQKIQLQQDSVNLLLTDVIMPGMDGRKLADLLKEKQPELRILFMSGYTENAIIHQGVLEENINFISKPFIQKNLLEEVRKVLDNPI